MKPGDGKLGRDQETLLERETLWKSRLPAGDVSMSLEQGKDESGGERKELAKVACLPRRRQAEAAPQRRLREVGSRWCRGL